MAVHCDTVAAAECVLSDAPDPGGPELRSLSGLPAPRFVQVRLISRSFTRASEPCLGCGRSGAPGGRDYRTRRSTIPGADGP